jgi:hypothetical protein
LPALRAERPEPCAFVTTRVCCLSQPDGPLRDEVAEPAREPRRTRRSALLVDRQGAAAATAKGDRARYGLKREPDLRRPRRQRAYNGHFGCTCYHPLFVFGQLGDVERRALRPSNVHSADGWRVVLEPVIARYRGIAKRLYFRGDAAFANPEVYEFLGAEGMGYAIRLPANTSCRARSDTCSSALLARHMDSIRWM